MKQRILLILFTSFSMMYQSQEKPFREKVSDFTTKIEQKSVQSLDEFITKYEPSISSKLGDLWEFSKSTTETLFDAYVRYLAVKDGFPVLMGLLFIFIFFLLKRRFKFNENTFNNYFPLLKISDNMTEYEQNSIRIINIKRDIFKYILNSLPIVVFWVLTVITLSNIYNNIYNLLQLAIAPEARVAIELINLWKS